MIKRIRNSILILFFSFFLFPLIAFAGSISASFTGNSNYAPGDTITLNVYVGTVNGGAKDADGKIVMYGGFVTYDSSCVQYVSISGHNGFGAQFNTSNNKLVFSDTSLTGVKNTTIGSLTFKALKDCNTTISMSGASASDIGGDLGVSFGGKNIVIYTPSSNNNLSSLKISPGSISFNKNTTSYNVSVDSNVTSVNISASAEDSKSRIEGTGSRGLNYGNNALNVIVTAENGATKTYTINVNRKDNRSGNNNLSSLNISNGKLNPGFGKNTTSYSMEVPYEVTRLNISANAEDSKARVDINNPELIAEETVTATITVTAENGATKTYTINVKRGKDPNKVLSKDNYLEKLSVSVGMLSPEFDKEKLNYAVYLPFEVSYIVVDTEVSDKRYATIEKVENNNLSIGNNLFKYTITAEDGSTRTYTLTVVRNKSLEEVTSNSNTYLKKVKFKNGLLTKKFNKKVSVYHYYSISNKVNITKAIPEVEENKVTINKIKDGFVVIVETPSGEKGYYVFVRKSLLMLIISILLVVGILVGGYFIIKKYKKGNNIEKKEKKDKKSKE